LSPQLLAHLKAKRKPVKGVESLFQVGEGGGLESTESLAFVQELYLLMRAPLKAVLDQRIRDRKFIDERTRSCRTLGDTILGQKDENGRIVAGPLQNNFAGRGGKPVAPLPEYLQGNHVTLFGPPDDPKLSINAMNAFHRKLANEPPVVAELLENFEGTPKWGADDEDSKTPLRSDLIKAGIHLAGCFNGDLSFTDPKSGKAYRLEKDHLSLPIKRFPGLALPSTFLFADEDPIPLHIYDFALHIFEHWKRPEALTFYVPKLENEEEARYIHEMIETADQLLQKRHAEYQAGTIRLLIVLENPRAIFRAHEIIDALYPYFAGASLGWHDYLASTARLFKEDPTYRIPVKADPDIVIKYIKASHELLADVVGSRGGVKIGGMYGVLPADGELSGASFQLTLKGFIKDVITQLKRDLSGFWVAHPDFVRLGLALVEAWKLHQKKESKPLEILVTALLDKSHHREIMDFILGPDITGLDTTDPNYPRSLIVADVKESQIIANNHPDEIRYNVFQSLQYLADWLSGNGCVALPAHIGDIPVRIMDDLATAERSRWEVWHEIYHMRFGLYEFLKIAHEEMQFIRKDLSTGSKIVQVKWDERTEKWYPVALRLMIRLMTDKKPLEFATELLMPFTIDSIRDAADPWAAAQKIDPVKFAIEPYIERFNEFFEVCGHINFARQMAKRLSYDANEAETLIRGFGAADIQAAASFHGDIGEGKRTLDHTAASEQAKVLESGDDVRAQLRELGDAYKEKFGFKFLISAMGKSGRELLAALKSRMGNSAAQELDNARSELWEISRKRLNNFSHGLHDKLAELMKSNKVSSASIHISVGPGRHQTLCFGADESTWFEAASLSKPIAAAFALEYFRKNKIPLSTPVNELLKKAGSTFKVASDEVQLCHLLNHTALGMHYVKGVPVSRERPKADGYLKEVETFAEPGTKFRYSGGGFLVLEHLLESLEKKSIQELTSAFFDKMGLLNLTFEQRTRPETRYALGESRLMFPACAAGAMGNARDMSRFLSFLSQAFQRPDGAGPISHDTAVRMLHGRDLGSGEFMGCKMGLGVFTIEAGANRLMVHQGANEGFRALFIHCYDGPDFGKGFTILCTGDFNGVLFVAQAAQEILRELNVTGLDADKFQSKFDPNKTAPESVVNQAYKTMLFKAFTPDLPEAIVRPGAKDPLAGKNLAVGAEILSVTNQGFARAENLLSPNLPTFDPSLFGRQGKIMDSWETVRHNPNGYDQIEFELKKASKIVQVSLSTQFHNGNHAEQARIEGLTKEGKWRDILPMTKLDGHAIQFWNSADDNSAFKNIRVTMVPDGGLSRIGLYAEPVEDGSRRFRDPIPKVQKPLVPVYSATPESIKKNWNSVQPDGEVDLASAAFGGKIIRASNEHYGPAIQVISPYAPIHMFDGFETARSRKAGHSEFVEIELGTPGRIHRLEIDFTYFRNNNPREIQIDGHNGGEWLALVDKSDVKAYAGNIWTADIDCEEDIIKLKITVFPDGGLNRVRAWSRV
jgi:allantoicase/malate synthase/2-oxo-4-hydroxy-4-carboxy--5-ureidoimidazoline (OHCU) decarboxylase